MASLGTESIKVLEPKPSQILSMFTKNGDPVYITLDGGATGSFIKHECALKHKFKIWNNNQSAGLADNLTSVKSIGYVEETFYRDNWSVKFKGLVVENLKADIYGGQPFMIDNDIIQRPAKSTITVHGKYTVLQTNQSIPTTQTYSAALITLSNLNLDSKILLPGQKIEISLPNNITSKQVCIEPRLENKNDSWPLPKILDNINGRIDVTNDTEEPIVFGKDVHLISATECATVEIDNIKHTPHTKVLTENKDNPANILKQNVEAIKNDLKDTHISDLHHIHNKYKDVFNGELTGYNGFYGKHMVSLQWADDTRPKSSRVHMPKWSSNKDKLLQQKIDQLTEMGVLTDPYKHDIQIRCVHPCFLQKKGRAAHKDIDDCDINEVRFLTAANSVNEKCRQVQTKIPDQTEIFKFVANNPFVIYADLYESFFQNHLHKRDWGYMAINSPFKGLRVYTRSTQGLLNQDEELNQLLSKVLGEVLMDGSCMKIADDLLIGGMTLEEAICNWEKVLMRLSKANLKLSASKVRIFPKEASIFGWTVRQGTISPDPHRQLTLNKINHIDIKTVGDLRSYMGLYKTFLIALPGVASLMDPFDKFVAGVKDSKAEVIWTEALITAFNTAKEQSKNSVSFLTLPRRNEQLILMPDATVKNPGIGFILNVVRDNKMLPVIFYSFKLSETQKIWFPCERECLALATAVKKCSHYILESTKPTLVLTDSKPVVEAANLIKNGKFSNSSRMSAFLCSINRYKVDVQHVSGKFKQNIAADYLSRNPAQCIDNNCQVCKFLVEISDCTIANISANSEIPLGTIESWSKIQQNDFACSEAYKRLKSGQQPSKKGSNSNDIKRYFNACQAKNLLVVEDKIPNTTQTRNRIVIPKNMVPAIITHLHVQDNKHLSSYQLEKTFNRNFFGIHTKSAIKDTIDNCRICRANKLMPSNVLYQNISDPQHPGCIFNVDVVRRHQQKILVCTDLFSSFSNATLIENEKKETLRDGIIQIITPIRAQNEIEIRTDSATGFQSLKNCPMLNKLKISLECTDPSNKNSIATVDNAIKQLEKEIVKIDPHSTQINATTLALALKNLNSLIRNRGLSSHEILFSRENISNKNLHLSDKNLAEKQKVIKSKNNSHPNDGKLVNENIKDGDFIAIRSDKNKHNLRDVFVVTKTFDEKLQINKMIRFDSPKAKIQAKPRYVRKCDTFLVNSRSKTDILPDDSSNITRPTTTKPVPVTAATWTAFGNFSVVSDDEDDHNTGNIDPYANLRRWENSQRNHAKRSLNNEICSPKPSTSNLINRIQVEQLQPGQSTNSEWDHNFDINSPHYNDNDDINSDDDVFLEAETEAISMNRVHNIDNLYDIHGLSIDTNQCQNVEALLPPARSTARPMKKVSPPRKELPIERDRRRGILTRSMSTDGDKVRLTGTKGSSNKVLLSKSQTRSKSKQGEERRRNAQ